ncbi:hypothetical protein WSM22_23410 [Cytophagales bacterium WSM2-2]|nr:hypothetical protein WSM22_23410 [Cytophagales bacterium WSM2-2]
MESKTLSWLKVTTGFQFLTAAVHSVSLITSPQGKNEMEKQLIDMMTNYRMDMGAGIHRSMDELVTALSSCFSLLYLLGALINLYLIRVKAPADLTKGLLGIETLVFGITFVIVAFLTFLPPIILTGLVFALLAICYFRLGKASRL